MPYHEVTDPFQTAQNVLFEQLRKAGAEKQRREREQEQHQSMKDYLREQVNNYNNGVDPTKNETGYGTEKTNRDVQDSMNKKLADKGIKVDNVDTKHVSDKTQDMIIVNGPTTDDKVKNSMNEKLADKGIKVDNVNTKPVSDKTQEMTIVNRPTTDDNVKNSMNEKLADKGIKVDNVNTKPVSNAEHVTMDRTQSKTDIAGTGTATTSGQTDKKFSVSTQPKPADSPLGDMETMSKMKTNTSTSTPTETTREKNESTQTSMNGELDDNGIKVGGVNSGAVEDKDENPC